MTEWEDQDVRADDEESTEMSQELSLALVWMTATVAVVAALHWAAWLVTW